MNQEMFNYSEEQKAKAAEFQRVAYEMGEPHIKDSGNRREFETGAVRDIAEGKGRCDLLPLDCISRYFSYMSSPARNPDCMKAETCSLIFQGLDEVLWGKAEGKVMERCIDIFILRAFNDKSGNALMELSKHYEQGAKKYEERNWQKGIPAHCYIDSCVRHLLKWYDGWTDEPHDRAVLWNLFGLWWTVKNKSECNDLPYTKEVANEQKATEKGV